MNTPCSNAIRSTGDYHDIDAGSIFTIPERHASYRPGRLYTLCAARRPSAANWKERDPQIPKSTWWLTNAPFVGFRLVRPRIQPSPEDIERYWLEAIEDYGI